MDLLVRKSIVRVKREGYIHNTRTASGLMLVSRVRYPVVNRFILQFQLPLDHSIYPSS